LTHEEGVEFFVKNSPENIRGLIEKDKAYKRFKDGLELGGLGSEYFHIFIDPNNNMSGVFFCYKESFRFKEKVDCVFASFKSLEKGVKIRPANVFAGLVARGFLGIYKH